ADRNRSHWSTSKTPSYTKSVSWQHHQKNEVRDAALIAAAQKVEHYEIASYGTLATLAEQLGYRKAAKLLKETLEEEKATDIKLTDLAINNVNKKAENKA
ncbi:ferritin-like domain-containing protein, partial [Escherichia coli]